MEKENMLTETKLRLISTVKDYKGVCFEEIEEGYDEKVLAMDVQELYWECKQFLDYVCNDTEENDSLELNAPYLLGATDVMTDILGLIMVG